MESSEQVGASPGRDGTRMGATGGEKEDFSRDCRCGNDSVAV